MTWTVSARGEIIGRAASLDAAARGCLNDMGRTLYIHDPTGRIAAIYRDGRGITDEPDPEAERWVRESDWWEGPR